MKKGYYQFNESVAIEGTGYYFEQGEVVYIWRQYTAGLSCECCGKGLAQANVIESAMDDVNDAPARSIAEYIAIVEEFDNVRESPFGDGHFNNFFNGKLDYLGKVAGAKVEAKAERNLPVLLNRYILSQDLDPQAIDDEAIANQVDDYINIVLVQEEADAKALGISLSKHLDCEPKDITAVKKFYAKVK